MDNMWLGRYPKVDGFPLFTSEKKMYKATKEIFDQLEVNVDPKTVQYLAGHENSKITMDIYAKVKYNKPELLSPVVNQALCKL